MSDVAAALRRLGSATVGEAGGRPLPPGLRAVWPGAVAAGPALTVRCAVGDNLAIHHALAGAQPGEVLCVVTDGEPAHGYWGEVLSVSAMARGVAGLVIDAGVRDTAAIEARGFPVFASEVAIPGATKVTPGAVRVAIEVRGVAIEPGDWVVADRDGVAVVPGSRLDAVVDAGRAREAKEAEMFRALEAGATTVDLLGLDPPTRARP